MALFSKRLQATWVTTIQAKQDGNFISRIFPVQIPLSMGGFCVSDYTERFTVRDSLVFYCEPSLKVKTFSMVQYWFLCLL